MKCLNTRGGCNKEAIYIEELHCSNFCSYECYLIYVGKKKPSINKRKQFKNHSRQKIHDLYIWAMTDIVPTGSNNLTTPVSEEWIIALKNSDNYLWDDFEKKYVRYILSYGLVDESGKLIADENSEYYRAVINRINDVQFNPNMLKHNNTPRPRKKRGVKQGTRRGRYKHYSQKSMYTFVCKGCGRTFTVELKARKKRQFHSETCRKRYWRRIKARKNALEKQNIVY